MSTKPFNFDDQSMTMRSAGPSGMLTICCLREDYPGRVQVKEGNYTGGGKQSAFIGRSDGNLGMKMEAWPVQNTNPLGWTGWGKY